MKLTKLFMTAIVILLLAATAFCMTGCTRSRGEPAAVQTFDNKAQNTDKASDSIPETDVPEELISVIPLKEDKIIEWKDSNIESAVRLVIDKPSGDIYLHDIWYLEKLIIGEKGITNIDDITSNFANLTSLNLMKNQITDISALKELKNLSTIILADNLISDISFLNELPNLINVNLGHNKITDINQTGNLKNLISLNLNQNPIVDSDFSIIGNLKKLKSLSLGGLNLTDISFIAELHDLDYLYLNDNQISNISAVKNLKKLMTLFLNGNKISDVSMLGNLTNLNSLYLGWNKISDISSFKALTNLTRLSLDSNQISDISVLKYLTKLKSVDLGWNQIDDISALKNLEDLEKLHIPQNYISDWSPVEHVDELMNSGNAPKSNSTVVKQTYEREYSGVGKNSGEALELKKDGTYWIYSLASSQIFSEGTYEINDNLLNLISNSASVFSYSIEGNLLKSLEGGGDYKRTIFGTYYAETLKSTIYLNNDYSWKEVLTDYTFNNKYYDQYVEEGFYEITNYGWINLYWDKECKKERITLEYENNTLIDFQLSDRVWVRID